MIAMGHASRQVESTQDSVHQQLGQTVLTHLDKPYRKPIQAHNLAAFADMEILRREITTAPILDSGCGNGESTQVLTTRFPDHLVFGIDRSLARLGETRRQIADNGYLIRANLEDIWRLCERAGWHLHRHFLFYPNPYPKPGQLRRRWHGHAVFPALLALGGQVEVRSNWQIYTEEFAAACSMAGFPGRSERLAVDVPISPFERKYLASGHSLYRCIAQLGT